MSDERYAPPTASLGDPTRERGTGRIDLGEAFREAWAALWANFPLLLGFSVLSFVLAVLSAVTVLGIFLVLPVLMWGGFRFALNVIDGHGEVSDLFSGFAEYGRVLGVMLILTILMVMVGIAGQSVDMLGRMTGSSLLIALGAIVNFFWSFGVMPRLGFAWYYSVDQDVSPVDALRTAWQVTSDQKLTCLVLGILSFLIPLIGVLCLVVGVIPALMLVYLLQTVAYRQLSGR